MKRDLKEYIRTYRWAAVLLLIGASIGIGLATSNHLVGVGVGFGLLTLVGFISAKTESES
jgi:hypothetical protein